MAFTPDGLIRLISLVDRPEGDKVVARANRAVLLPKLIRPLSGAAVAYGLAGGLAGLGTRALLPAGIVGLLTMVIALLDKAMPTAERHRDNIAKVSGGLGLFIGVAAPLLAKENLWTALAAGVGGFVVMWLIAQFGLTLVALLVSMINVVLRIFASPIAVPILTVLASLNNRSVKNSGWTTSSGTPIVVFNRDGIKQVNHANEPIFVSSPRLRAGGAALAAGIPLFTFTELSNSSLVTQRMSDAYQAVADAGTTAMEQHSFADHPLMTFAEINPANGLPMLDGIGGMDVMGNAYGFDNQQFHHDPGMQHGGFDHI